MLAAASVGSPCVTLSHTHREKQLRYNAYVRQSYMVGKFCQRTNPAWREKDIMTHMLILYPTLGKRILE
jgi:hypothetical protein